MKRKIRRLDEMLQMHARYEQSGLTLAEFCETENINKCTFQYWRTKIKLEQASIPPVASPSVGFRQIMPESAPFLGVIRLHLSEDRTLELPSDYPSTQLLEILRGLSC